MASGPITSWQIDRGKVETVADIIFLGSRITPDCDCSHEIKRHLLLGRKVMTNLDSILKSRDITLLTKVHLIKAIVFPVVMYGCESWTIKKAAYMHGCVWAQSCPILCDSMDCGPLGSSVYGISQARVLEWVAISFSRGAFWYRDGTWVFCIAGGFLTNEPPGKAFLIVTTC